VIAYAKFKLLVLPFSNKMSSSKSLEEKFEALMKSYQTFSSSNNELKQRLDKAKMLTYVNNLTNQ